MATLASLPIKYAMLVGGSQSYSGGEGPTETHLQNSGFLLNPEDEEQDLPGQDYTAPHAPRCLNWNAFLPDKLLYQDV